ncbi:hypothetical protein AVEN_163046-1 [Araneus ventricosus]|uniref:Uncharacterized protein n=1 Tax=Araneus ventricosus TaxID=182803 RepID=A0A4Y2J6E9_ARAVE|nr:hypothetical protein AVEN_163046-1 [Araneus ventricosus]
MGNEKSHSWTYQENRMGVLRWGASAQILTTVLVKRPRFNFPHITSFSLYLFAQSTEENCMKFLDDCLTLIYPIYENNSPDVKENYRYRFEFCILNPYFFCHGWQRLIHYL